MRTNLEVILKSDHAFDIEKQLNRYKNVKASSVSTTVIRVHFNDDKISAKKVLKLIMQAQGTGKREKNIRSLKRINEAES